MVGIDPLLKKRSNCDGSEEISHDKTLEGSMTFALFFSATVGLPRMPDFQCEA